MHDCDIARGLGRLKMFQFSPEENFIDFNCHSHKQPHSLHKKPA